MLKYAKVTNEKNGECDVGTGTNIKFYQSLGMTLQDVCQSNGNWYLTELCPPDPETTYQEKRAAEYPDYKEYLDAQVKLNSGEEALIIAGKTQLEAYYAACLAVKAKYPKLE